MPKRTIDSCFAPPSKKAKVEHVTPASPTILKQDIPLTPDGSTHHPSSPWPTSRLPSNVFSSLTELATARGKPITHQTHLDLLSFQPFIPPSTSTSLFKFLRSQLFFHRVSYPIKPNGIETTVNTPRCTTVFGVDDTFWHDGVLSNTHATRLKNEVQMYPRPIPECLGLLRRVTGAAKNTTYNICLVSYYASGNDSISYHTDDEHSFPRGEETPHVAGQLSRFHKPNAAIINLPPTHNRMHNLPSASLTTAQQRNQ